MFEPLILAFGEIFHPWTLAFMLLGTCAGIIAGAIPGFTITMAVVLTLPFTFGMSAAQGLATMLGVYVGGLSGGLMSGVLTGIPGTPSSVATVFDGFPMARGGKPGLALGLGLWSSFFGGLISAVMLVLFAPMLARIGLEFGPWDFFSLVLFALTMTASLAGEILLKGIIAGIFGLFAATVGEDQIAGVERFTFGSDVLESGFPFLPVLVGLFAFSQLLSDIEDRIKARAPLMDAREALAVRVPHLESIRITLTRWANLVRSSLIGVFVGVLPAAGGSISNILAYDQARKASREPEKFGTGYPDGIVAPEAANNATAGGALIMMMALGIPGDIVTAVMLGALLIHNIAPSPTFIADNPQLAYGVFVAFFLSLFMTVGVQTICLRAFLLIVRIPMYMLAVVILVYTAFGVFALNNSISDIWVLFFFGILGYVMRKTGFPLAPMILGVVLGTTAELNLQRAVAISDDLTLFVTRPWSLIFLTVSAYSLFFPYYQKWKGDRAWTAFYGPSLMILLSVPVMTMGGWFRPLIGVGLLIGGAYLSFRAWQTAMLTRPASDTPMESASEKPALRR